MADQQLDWSGAGNVRVGVAVLLHDGHGRVLVGRRKGSHGAGTWQLPGGHLEMGEEFEACAAREVEEETGLRCDTDFGKLRLATVTNDVMAAEKKHYVTVFMQADRLSDTEARVLEPNKCDGWEWKALADVPEPRFIPLQNLIDSGFDVARGRGE